MFVCNHMLARIEKDTVLEYWQRDMLQAFNLFDQDGSGSIDSAELGSCLRALGQVCCQTTFLLRVIWNNHTQRVLGSAFEAFSCFVILCACHMLLVVWVLTMSQLRTEHDWPRARGPYSFRRWGRQRQHRVWGQWRPTACRSASVYAMKKEFCDDIRNMP
jgi:hypothetical protein